MAKTDKRERATTTFFRIVPARNAKGELVPGRWNTEEVTVEGVVTKKLTHEREQTLAVARERFFSLSAKARNRSEPEKW